MKWYALTDMIQYIPGTALKGEVTYKAGFFDLPRGLQTHCFAAGGVELQVSGATHPKCSRDGWGRSNAHTDRVFFAAG